MLASRLTSLTVVRFPRASQNEPVVRCISAVREGVFGGGQEYLVFWQGYAEPTWELAANLSGCTALSEFLQVQQFVQISGVSLPFHVFL